MRFVKALSWPIGALVIVLTVLSMKANGETTAARQLASDTVARIHAQIDALDLTERETVWNKAGWVFDYDQALDLSRRTNRPIFLYAMYGRLDGRC